MTMMQAEKGEEPRLETEAQEMTERLSQFYMQKPEGLRPLDLAVFTYWFVGGLTAVCDSHETIAMRLGCGRKAVGRSIRRLNAVGLTWDRIWDGIGEDSAKALDRLTDF